ncbi:MAG: PEP-CTERM sorting domain-containing protein [Akkermansiaceae bacterium]
MQFKTQANLHRVQAQPKHFKRATSKALLSAIAMTTSLSFFNQAEAVVLFRDTFSRAAGTDLNASGSGKSGLFGSSDWVESSNGRLANGDAVIVSGNRMELQKPGGDANGNNGAMIYIDNNFSNLSSFRVDMRVLSGSSAGNGRFFGFSVGQSKAELDAQNSASPTAAPGDFSIFYDSIGSTKGIYTRKNGGSSTLIQTATPYPRTLSAEFTFADMNAGTALDYDILLDGTVIGSGSTAWSGTGENYVSLQSNYTGFSRINFVEVSGEIAPDPIPEPSSLSLLGLSGLLIFRRRR